jgi:hypothetical protein
MWWYVGSYLTIPFMGSRLRSPIFLVLAAAAAGTAGCGHPLSRKLEGRWFGSGVESFEQRELPAAVGWAKGVSFEFSGEKITVAIPAEEPRTAPYRIEGVHGSDVKLGVTRPDGKIDPLALRMDDEQSMRWMLDSVHSVVLKRE